jgi:hypothetical protein
MSLSRLFRLLRAVALIFLFPLLHFGAALAITVREGRALDAVLVRFLGDELLIAALPLALINGRFPTANERARTSSLDFAGIGFWLILVWIAVGVLLIWLANRVLHYRWGKVGVSGLIALTVVWAIIPTLPQPRSLQIQVDLNRSLGPMPNLHRGFSQGGEGQMQQSGYFEAAMARLSEVTPALIRIDHLYDYYGVYTLAANGSSVYDWSGLDRQIDAILAAGAQPLMSLSYTPPALTSGSVHDPPNDLAAWEELVYQTVYYYNIERGLNIRYWEVWNEPNIAHFWTGTLEQYADLYAATARGVLRADASVLVGGPALASGRDSSLAYFNEHNWVMALVNRDLPLHFLSWHLYSTDPRDYTRSIAAHRDWVAAMSSPPLLFITEWNWTGGKAAAMDNGTTVAYVPAVIAAMSDAGLDQAYFFEPIEGRLEPSGYWGMLYADTTIKPVFNSFRVLSQLSGERLHVQSAYPGLGALASREGAIVQILIWNDRSGLVTAPVELVLSGIAAGSELQATIYGMDSAADTLLIGTAAFSTTITVDVPENGIRLLQFELPDQVQ